MALSHFSYDPELAERKPVMSAEHHDSGAYRAPTISGYRLLFLILAKRFPIVSIRAKMNSFNNALKRSTIEMLLAVQDGFVQAYSAT